MFNYQQKINATQQVLTKEQYEQLIANGKNRGDHVPVVKFFDPLSAGKWLISEMDEEGYAFGLCDLGMGSPELGDVYLPELIEIQHVARKPFKMGIERDTHISFDHPMSWYVEEANKAERITV